MHPVSLCLSLSVCLSVSLSLSLSLSLSVIFYSKAPDFFLRNMLLHAPGVKDPRVQLAALGVYQKQRGSIGDHQLLSIVLLNERRMYNIQSVRNSKITAIINALKTIG